MTTSVIARYCPLLLLVLVWELVTGTRLVSPQILPTFSSVVVSFFSMMGGDLAHQAALSLARGLAGWTVAVVFGIAVGVLMAWYRPIRLVVKPFIQLLYPLPQSALIPIVIVWLGLGSAAKVTLIFLGCLLPIVVSTFNAVRGVDQLLVWSARSVGAREPALLWEIVIPAAAPEILNGMRVALALSFILVVAEELIFGNGGIGFLISFLGEHGDLPGMFAGVFAISLIGFAADRLFVASTRRMIICEG